MGDDGGSRLTLRRAHAPALAAFAVVVAGLAVYTLRQPQPVEGAASAPWNGAAAARRATAAAPSVPHPVAATRPIEADFRLGTGRIVRLTFEDRDNFRLELRGGDMSTLVLDGQVYLHFRPSPGAAARLLWVAGLGDGRVDEEAVALPRLPQSMPPAVVRTWQATGPVFDVAVPASGPFGAADRVTVTPDAALAAAQATIATRLVPAMDMTLCGDAVGELVSWWPARVAGAGLAIVGTASGISLARPVAAWRGRLGRPAGVRLEEGLKSTRI